MVSSHCISPKWVKITRLIICVMINLCFFWLDFLCVLSFWFPAWQLWMISWLYGMLAWTLSRFVHVYWVKKITFHLILFPLYSLPSEQQYSDEVQEHFSRSSQPSAGSVSLFPPSAPSTSLQQQQQMSSQPLPFNEVLMDPLKLSFP